MITLPLQDFIDLHTKSTMQLHVKEHSVEAGASVTVLTKPNALGEVLTITYPKVTYSNADIIERALRGTRGTERISYLSKKYVIDGYEATYTNKYVTITLTLLQVG